MLSFLWKICKWTITWTDFRLFGLIVTENYASAAKLKDQNFCQRVLHSSPLNRNRILQMPSSKFTRNWGGGACGMWSRLDWTLAWVEIPSRRWKSFKLISKPSEEQKIYSTRSCKADALANEAEIYTLRLLNLFHKLLYAKRFFELQRWE